MKKVEKPSKQQSDANFKMMKLLKQNTKNMTIKQTNLYLEHLKNKLKDGKNEVYNGVIIFFDDTKALVLLNTTREMYFFMQQA